MNCSILFGSETGTAEDLAYKLYRYLNPYFSVKLLSMDDYDLTSFSNENIMIFICSTCGDLISI